MEKSSLTLAVEEKTEDTVLILIFNAYFLWGFSPVIFLWFYYYKLILEWINNLI